MNALEDTAEHFGFVAPDEFVSALEDLGSDILDPDKRDAWIEVRR